MPRSRTKQKRPRGRPKRSEICPAADFLRIRKFARHLKQNLLPHADQQRPEAQKVVDALQKIRNIGTGRWSQWWNGKEMPSGAMQDVLKKCFPEAISWLHQSLDDPLRRHFVALDLLGMTHAKDGDVFEVRYVIAQRVLFELTKLWTPPPNKPWRFNDDALPGEFDAYKAALDHRKSVAVNEWRRRQPLTKSLPLEFTMAIAPLELSSVILRIFEYGLTCPLDRICNPRQWILDFATSAICLKSLGDTLRQHSWIAENGQLGCLYLLAYDILWSDNELLPADSYRLLQYASDFNCDPYELAEFFQWTRTIYRNEISLLGVNAIDMWNSLDIFLAKHPIILRG